MNPALLKLIAQFGKWAAKGLIGPAATSLLSEGVSVGLAKEVVAAPDVYRRLVKMANRRIRILRKARMLKSSYAYQLLYQELLHPQQRKTISLLSNAGKLFGNKHRSDYLGNALSLLKFLASESSTPKGIRSIMNKKKANFIEQILKNTKTTPQEEQMLRETLITMSDAEFRRIAKLYEPVLNMGSATKAGYGSEESFNLIGSHMIQRMKVIKKASSAITGRSFIDSVENSRKLKYMNYVDPNTLGGMSIESIGRFMGAGDVTPIPLQNSSGSDIVGSIAKSALKTGLKTGSVSKAANKALKITMEEILKTLV